MTVNRKTKLFTVAILLALVVPTVLSIAPALACGGCDCPCTGTPGYWKNHPEAWPVDEITIGDEVFSKEDALDLLNTPVKGDKSITMFKALAAALLNEANGCNVSCIAPWINEGQLWFTDDGPFGPGYDCGDVGGGVPASSACWQYSHGELIYWWLDEYNNGRLGCAAPRD